MHNLYFPIYSKLKGKSEFFDWNFFSYSDSIICMIVTSRYKRKVINMKSTMLIKIIFNYNWVVI